MQFDELFDESNDFKASRRKRVGGYVLGSVLGEGSFAKVRLGSHIMTRERVAIKVINKKLANKREYVKKNMRREAVLLQKLDHPNIARLFEVLETQNSFYIVMELSEGGNFLKYINRRRQLSEHEARRFMRQIISAVDHMHRSGVLHRDLKIENLMLDRHSDIKIIDFGLSNTWDGTTLLETQCGSPAYSAPEIFSQKQYGPAVDVWSIGVNLYAMLTGNLPFTVDPPNNLTKLHAQILRGCKVPDFLSKDCQDLISRMLDPADHRRITIPEILSHKWITLDDGPIKRYERKAMLPNDDINTIALSYMLKRLDLSEADIRKIIINRRHNATTAIYHLLCQRITRGVGLPDRVCLDNVEKGKAEHVYKQMRKQILDKSQREIASIVTLRTNKSAGRATPSGTLPSVPSQNLRSVSGALAVAGSDFEGDLEMEEKGIEMEVGLPRISKERFNYRPRIVVESSTKRDALPADGMLTSKLGPKSDYKNYLKELQKQRKRQTKGKSILKPDGVKAVKAVHMNIQNQNKPAMPDQANDRKEHPRLSHGPRNTKLRPVDVSENKAVRFDEKLDLTQPDAINANNASERLVIRRINEERKPSSQSRYSDISESIGSLSRESSGLSHVAQRMRVMESLQREPTLSTPPPPPNSALGHRRDSDALLVVNRRTGRSPLSLHNTCSAKVPVYQRPSLDTKENTFYEKYRFKFMGQRSSGVDSMVHEKNKVNNRSNFKEANRPVLEGRSRTMPDIRNSGSGANAREETSRDNKRAGGIRKIEVAEERKLNRTQTKDQVQFRKLGVYYTMPDNRIISETRPRKQAALNAPQNPRRASCNVGMEGDLLTELNDMVKPIIQVPNY